MRSLKIAMRQYGVIEIDGIKLASRELTGFKGLLVKILLTQVTFKKNRFYKFTGGKIKRSQILTKKGH
ncbi:protein of unknown function [Xenorhabdus poinarii G6]|uniref:Uncharacterized protein n=1 Tax=Xenorhabdus poinarii G6 TaxID=1354304 RepID=A0A068R3I2_9GAMM|nr:protein of unknown function [Xenorhabdus poinarii G6]